ncbi:hypothetical protein BN938_1120 [Mucinivorans hirudinis]|uniref:Uncharacterized protein n=1 Tax=Mucinivorans hirudinis TaxID=1433126 RepID=A0A060R7I7_9BACT|nr:hypothetical protein BN938_1120 [Mucinivorans hirudinis]
MRCEQGRYLCSHSIKSIKFWYEDMKKIWIWHAICNVYGKRQSLHKPI